MTTLLVCSAGGHLKQLHNLVPRLQLDDDVVWFTFDTGLSRSLLADERLVVAKYAAPREVRPLMVASRQIGKFIKRHNVRRAISTGSGLALAAFPHILLRGGECHYIESAARADGPSVTGKICEYVPKVKLYSQYKSWSNDKWRYRGSVLDGFAASMSETNPVMKRVVVSLGTSRTHGFRRLVERLVRVMPKEAEVLWQTGSTDVSGLGITARESVPADELQAAILNADAVISHAGTGSALTALEAGKLPLLVPRRRAYGEHIDDHQIQIAAELDNRGVAHCVEAEALTEEDIKFVARHTVKANPNPPTFELDTAGRTGANR